MNEKLERKIEMLKKESSFLALEESKRDKLIDLVKQYGLTFQESKKLNDVILDFRIWDEQLNLDEVDGEGKKAFLNDIFNKWESVKSKPNNYLHFTPDQREVPRYKFVDAKNDSKILGDCPVASEKTRCCNLMTLDVVRNCGFDCNYCCIQSFFHDDQIIVETNLLEKLRKIEFNPHRNYHIGTGQSSDSLMWGDKYNHLTDLCEFIIENKNIILELKTKSNNIADLLKIDFPQNFVATWTLNTETIIKNEERMTASLDERLKAARKVADRGIKVGFHFHPMVYYEGFKEEYAEVIRRVKDMFDPKEIVMISFGTLTYIKPIIKMIRKRNIKSKVLEMPFNDVEGKLSYPQDIKLELFKHFYHEFSDWHHQVFFYMCMEEIGLWKDVFGYEYKDNKEFEAAMIHAYKQKLGC